SLTVSFAPLSFFLLPLPPPPTSPLFPYTTLFRSRDVLPGHAVSGSSLLAGGDGSRHLTGRHGRVLRDRVAHQEGRCDPGARGHRSEEHTSELQSLAYLVCRLLLEKKKKQKKK